MELEPGRWGRRTAGQCRSRQYTRKALCRRERHGTVDERALPLCLVGVLIAVLPAVLLHSPGDEGPVGFAVMVGQALMVLVGAGVVGIGVHSYRSGNLEPAAATYVAILEISVIGVVGAQIETTGGPLVPVWVWLLLLVVSLAVAVLSADTVERMLDTASDG